MTGNSIFLTMMFEFCHFIHSYQHIGKQAQICAEGCEEEHITHIF